MTKIKLIEIAISNFKGLRFLKLNMRGEDACIQGANGSGKTSIYKAYYWCLTGKTLEPNETVQVLDENNEVIHKIETSVYMVLSIDDSYEVTLERKLVEKWKAKDMPNETFDGTEQKQFFNDIPLNKTEFAAKLNGICDLEKWILLSNINTFMTLKMENRRKMLMEIAGEVDEQTLMAPYPAVLKAVNMEKKSVEELQKQCLSTKKRSNDELRTIPSQINAQDKLRVVEDFESIEEERNQLERDIADTDKLLEGSSEELEASKSRREKIQALNTKLDEDVREWKERHDKAYEEAVKAISEAQADLDNAKKEKKDFIEEQVKKQEKIQELETTFEQKKKEWEATNKLTFSAENFTSCPTCGHIFTEEEKIEKQNTAIEKFNKDKSEKLQTLLNEATKINEQRCVLTGSYNEGKQIIMPSRENLVNEKQAALNEKKQELEAIKQQSIDTEPSIIAIKEEIKEAETAIPQNTDNGDRESIRAKKKDLVARRDELTKKLGGIETNQRIEKEKERLNNRAEELAQIVADCDSALYQIMEYKKAKVNVIEEKINGLFKFARWKFFKKNIIDDNYTEICNCLHNGIDYNSINAASKINLNIDIVSSIGKAYGIEAPVFVDNSESVAKVLPIDNQLITLKHIPGSELKMETQLKAKEIIDKML